MDIEKNIVIQICIYIDLITFSKKRKKNYEVIIS